MRPTAPGTSAVVAIKEGQMRVFVSYDWDREKDATRRIITLLKDAGLEPIVAPPTPGIEDLRLKMARTLLTCNAYCAILFPDESFAISRWVQYEISIAERYRIPAFLFVEGSNMGVGHLVSSITKVNRKLNGPDEWYQFSKGALASGELDEGIKLWLHNVATDIIEPRYAEVQDRMRLGLSLEMALYSNIAPFPAALEIIGDAFDQCSSLTYEAAADAARRITGARFGFVGLLEPVPDSPWTNIRITGFSGQDEAVRRELDKQPLRFNDRGETEGVTGEVAYTGKCFCSGDVRSLSAHPHFVSPGVPIRSELCVPILLRKHAVGVIDVEDPAADKFHQGHEIILEWLARVVSLAYKADQLEAFVRDIASAGTAEQKWMDRILLSLMGWSGADYGLIARREDGGTCPVRAIKERGLVPEVQHILAQLDIAKSGGVTKRVLETGEPVYAEDVTLVKDHRVFWPNISSEIVLPIRLGSGSVTGVVDLEFKNRQEFATLDRLLYESLANLIAVGAGR
jgi:putative methionine-R-sulfoxide reductase with GAF domain